MMDTKIDTPRFHFQVFKAEDLPLLFEWLGLPHVSDWWRESRDYKTFHAKYTERLSDSSIGQFLICDKTNLIGFIKNELKTPRLYKPGDERSSIK
ncbi:MAG: acetyltransferase [Candidatus Babeliales bacterium]